MNILPSPVIDMSNDLEEEDIQEIPTQSNFLSSQRSTTREKMRKTTKPLVYIPNDASSHSETIQSNLVCPKKLSQAIKLANLYQLNKKRGIKTIIKPVEDFENLYAPEPSKRNDEQHSDADSQIGFSFKYATEKKCESSFIKDLIRHRSNLDD